MKFNARTARIGPVLLAAVCAGGLMAMADAGVPLAGPVGADVITVVDGDTLRVRARIWLDQDVESAVRLAGIDAPERRSHCAAERALAARSQQTLERLVDQGPAGQPRVLLYDIAFGKYAGQ